MEQVFALKERGNDATSKDEYNTRLLINKIVRELNYFCNKLSQDEVNRQVRKIYSSISW